MEFLGILGQIHNPDFNYGEFAIIKSQAGLNSYKISEKSGLKKRTPLVSAQKPEPMPNLNVMLINDGMPQQEWPEKLNAIAIGQMKILTQDHGIGELEAHGGEI